MTGDAEREVRRILEEHARRLREIPSDFYGLHRPVNLFMRQGQERALRDALDRAQMLPLGTRRILEVGCGTGGWFGTFENFGAQRTNIAGVDLDKTRAEVCTRRFPEADIRHADASRLPWADGGFDIVFQSTVFTSILDDGLKRAVASEMLRVLSPCGAAIWYDFSYNNPLNPSVRGIGQAEIRHLFLGCEVWLSRVTLAPPIARRLVPFSWTTAFLLEGLKLLNTHYIGVIRKRR